ncbi:2-hydroxychromene-2-carboxylate isomerase [Shimia sp. SK013]|uniref:2-hydroxychromene-2-carboxylate isomerase n=1 Tax=Shimia sp. SK013 TaxID=1389006 RepID=UPI0006B643C9|nr:2-hydroxychromene-2-carboxylate isomerase [Shimia sp. SK013]KPA20954.1 2-hydroxychromene-2-carboxylate isomerase [Shimia sp. SK013]
MTLRDIEYFYSTHSAFAYLGAKKLAEICEAHDCRLIHRPFALSPVVEAAGGLSFAGRTQAHVDYFFGREIERWAEYRGVPVIAHRPTYHDNALHLSSGMLIAAEQAGLDVDALSFAMLQGHWRDDTDLANPEDLARVAETVGVDAAPLIMTAMTPNVQAVFEENTQEALARGVFGSPTYFVDGDMFYGQDHLELVERAVAQPFAVSSFKNPPVDG